MPPDSCGKRRFLERTANEGRAGAQLFLVGIRRGFAQSRQKGLAFCLVLTPFQQALPPLHQWCGVHSPACQPAINIGQCPFPCRGIGFQGICDVPPMNQRVGSETVKVIRVAHGRDLSMRCKEEEALKGEGGEGQKERYQFCILKTKLRAAIPLHLTRRRRLFPIRLRSLVRPTSGGQRRRVGERQSQRHSTSRSFAERN